MFLLVKLGTAEEGFWNAVVLTEEAAWEELSSEKELAVEKDPAVLPLAASSPVDWLGVEVKGGWAKEGSAEVLLKAAAE